HGRLKILVCWDSLLCLPIEHLRTTPCTRARHLITGCNRSLTSTCKEEAGVSNRATKYMRPGNYPPLIHLRQLPLTPRRWIIWQIRRISTEFAPISRQSSHFSGVVPIEFSAQPFTVRENLNIGDAL